MKIKIFVQAISNINYQLSIFIFIVPATLLFLVTHNISQEILAFTSSFATRIIY